LEKTQLSDIAWRWMLEKAEATGLGAQIVSRQPERFFLYAFVELKRFCCQKEKPEPHGTPQDTSRSRARGASKSCALARNSRDFSKTRRSAASQIDALGADFLHQRRALVVGIRPIGTNDSSVSFALLPDGLRSFTAAPPPRKPSHKKQLRATDLDQASAR
jgi:hypothetical protein